uniref:FAD/NAD(P)-binding oxidoreductase n=1 Tax=Roseihalotalea indica TaxID=2867963 RepID=A0AA49JIE1_9BACT|nr:FAD/NAD(P)-binding oxidoreductase [Tunicatimonas sp. TK19036]
MKASKHTILIIGGGTAGITVAAQLLRKDKSLDIGIIEPSDKHYYQPAWTLVGAGTYDLEDTIREEKKFIPTGATWIKEHAQQIDPEQQIVSTQEGRSYAYDYLVVAPGIQLDWDAIPGLKEGIGKNGLTTNYDKRYVEYTWELLQNFKGGNALFTQPATPIKCGGAPQKIMYLADDYFRKHGIRDQTNVIFATSGTVIFGVEKFANTLNKIVKERNIHTRFFHRLIEIRPEKKEAVYEVTKEDWLPVSLGKGEHQLGIHSEGTSKVVIPYEMMHLAPPQSAPDFIKQSPLAVPDSPYGWVDVDKHTLQHNRYGNVFSLGDVASTPNAKTGAAIRKQAPVLVTNLLSVMHQHSNLRVNPQYQGYGSCPMVTRYGRMMLAEFDYENHPVPSFPFNTAKERWSMWLLKKYFLPWFYWHRMLKGKG